MVSNATIGRALACAGIIVVAGAAADRLMPRTGKSTAAPFGVLTAIASPAQLAQDPDTVALARRVRRVDGLPPETSSPPPPPPATVAAQPAPEQPVQVASADPALPTNPSPVPQAADPTPDAAAPVDASAASPLAYAPTRSIDPLPTATAPAETAALDPQPSTGAAPEGPGKVRPGMLVDINTASAETLDHLPGMGRIGKTIIRHRPYKSIQELVDRRVLKSSDFQRLRSKIRA